MTDLGIGIGAGIGRAATGRQRAVPAPALAELLARAESRRIDIVGIGDSNQLFGGIGWDHGFQFALSGRFAMYATGLISVNENNGSGAGVGYLYSRLGGTAPGVSSGAPAALDAFLGKGSGGTAPLNYAWLAPGASVTSPAGGLLLQAANPIGHQQAVDFDLHHGTFAEPATIRPQIRRGSSPFTSHLLPAAISVNTGTLGVQRTTLSLQPDAARAGVPLEFRLQAGGQTQAGPFFGLYLRASNPGRMAGFAYHTLNARGGQPLRAIAHDLQQMGDLALTYFFGEVRRLQGPEKTVIVVVNSGLNDRNPAAGSVSVGPNPVGGSSAAAFIDNLEAIRIRLEAIWTLNGWPLAELHVAAMVSHPVAPEDDAAPAAPGEGSLAAYRAACAAWASPAERRHHLDLAAVTTHGEMLAAGWYASGGGDRSHLVQAGYETLALRVLARE